MNKNFDKFNLAYFIIYRTLCKEEIHFEEKINKKFENFFEIACEKLSCKKNISVKENKKRLTKRARKRMT